MGVDEGVGDDDGVGDDEGVGDDDGVAEGPILGIVRTSGTFGGGQCVAS